MGGLRQAWWLLWEEWALGGHTGGMEGGPGKQARQHEEVGRCPTCGAIGGVMDVPSTVRVAGGGEGNLSPLSLL